VIEVEFAGQYFKGDKGLNWKGAYINTTPYLKDDAVFYNGSSYVALQNSTGNLPTNTTFWSILAQKGDNGSGSPVTSVNAKIGDVVLVPSDIGAATSAQGALANTAVQPSGLNKAAVGLSNVDNTSDINKPISTAVQSSLDLKAPLNSPSFTGTVTGLTKATVGLDNVDNTADIDKPLSTLQTNALSLKAPLNSPTFTGTVAGLNKTFVGLGSVDNTSDLSKPVSTAQQAALNLKANVESPAFTGNVTGIDKTMVGLSNVDNTTDANKPISTAQAAALALKAPLDSPAFTGTVTGLTKSTVGLGNVDNISDLNKPISTATQTALNLKANLASPTFTGTVGGITASMVGLGNVNNTADTAKPISTATQSALDLKAPLASPTFTGTVNGISAAMVGLGNVNNTSDANKPVSSATQTALNLKADLTTLANYRLLTNNAFTGTSAATAFPTSIGQLAPTTSTSMTWTPLTASQAVVPAMLTTVNINTATANTVTNSHGIGELVITTVQGGGYCDLSFAKEYRFAMQNASTAGQFIGTKYVFEPDSTNSGTLNTFITEQFDNMTTSVTWISNFQRNFLDPRMVTYHAGGQVAFAQIITGNYTFTDKDSGKTFVYNSASLGTMTFGAGITNGFKVTIKHGLGGAGVTLVSSSRTIVNNATRVASLFALDEVTVEALDPGGFLTLNWKDPLPTYSVNNTTSIIRNVTTNSSVSDLTVNLEANSVYEVSFNCAYTTTATAQSLKLGYASTATGATFLFDAGVQITNVAGTASTVLGPLNTTAATIAGTASVASVEQNAFIRGKIITSSTAGNFAIQVGAISTATTLTIAIGRAPLLIKKIK
jgi:hypothetical protein